MRDKILLRQLQALPLNAKVLMTQQRIREWYNYFNGNVCISFSGGKDSTVLTYLVHDMYPNVPLVFANTGLEYPEIQAFAREMGAEFVRPKMRFDEVISKYGYPIIGKEVAEAISFARRIVKNSEGGGCNLKTETDRTVRHTEQRTACTDGLDGGEQTLQGTLRYPRKNRAELQGRRNDTRKHGTQYLSTPPKRNQKNQQIQTATPGEVMEPG